VGKGYLSIDRNICHISKLFLNTRSVAVPRNGSWATIYLEKAYNRLVKADCFVKNIPE